MYQIIKQKPKTHLLLVFAWQNKKGREISSQLTWISTELDALAPVRDSFSRVAGVDDVAFIPCGAMQRLISVLSGAAGLSCKGSPKVINCGFVTPR